MMKMKRILAVLLAFVLVCAIFPTCVSAASASFKLSGSGTVTVGNQVKVTVSLSSSEKIGSWRFSVKYDPAVLEYVSGADSGGGGAVSFADSSDGTTSFSRTINFRTKKVADTSVSVISAQVVSFESASNMTVNSPSKKISIVAAPDLSGENQLSALSVSTGELTPAFAEGTTAYTLSVPYEITSLSVFATAKDAKAKVSVTPSDALAVGETPIEVVVTAENGSKRTYTITVTRAESELAGVTVDLNDETYSVAYDPATLTVPEGYLPTTATFGEKKILVFSSPKETLKIAYLTKGEAGEWYIYNEESRTFSEYLSVSGKANTVVILTPAETVDIPEGFLPQDLTVGENVWPAYKTENSHEDGIWLVYGMNVEGDCGFYYYDEEQSVFTSYFKPYEDKSALEEASKEAANLNSLLKESEEKADQMEIMFLSAAAVATLLLILLIVSLATRKKGSKKVKAERSDTTDEIEAEGKNEPEESKPEETPAPAPVHKRRARRTLDDIGHKEEPAAPEEQKEEVKEMQEEKEESSEKKEEKKMHRFSDDIPPILR